MKKMGRPPTFQAYKIGDRIGILTILDAYLGPRTKDTTHTVYWYKCKCDCGNIVTRNHYSFSAVLKHPTFKAVCSKQCPLKKYLPRKVYGDISLYAIRQLRNGAKKRGIEFNVSLEYLNDLYLKQDKRCAISGEEITFDLNNKVKDRNITASLDRIDNDKGYIEGNVQWIHKEVNRMKQDFGQVHFLEMCELVANHNPEIDTDLVFHSKPNYLTYRDVSKYPNLLKKEKKL